jgi:hypothetical protein
METARMTALQILFLPIAAIAVLIIVPIALLSPASVPQIALPNCGTERATLHLRHKASDRTSHSASEH